MHRTDTLTSCESAGREHAVVDIEKLHEYCLNPQHPRGRHKARVFASALLLRQPDAELLRIRLLEAAKANDAIAGEADQYGQRYIIDFEVVTGGVHAMVRSAWIILFHEGFPRFITRFVLSNKGQHDRS